MRTRGLTNLEVARAAGWSDNSRGGHVARLRKGTARSLAIDPRRAHAIARFLGVSPYWLFTDVISVDLKESA